MTDEDAALLHRLLDIHEIGNLKARYFRTLDHKDWAGFGQVFTEDAVMELPEMELKLAGRESIVEMVSKTLASARTVHHGHMPEIELTGPDTARGTWAMADYVEWPPAGSGERAGLRGYGHYVEEYTRAGGQWRISRCRLDRLRVDRLSSAEATAGT
jgi:uncharacterized protein (TIGR02246 family)